MNSLYKYSVSLIAAIAMLTLLTLALGVRTRADGIVGFGFPFTFYEQDVRGVLVHRFIRLGATADTACLIFLVAFFALSWDRLPRVVSGAFALFGAFYAIEAGSGVAVLITRTYRFIEYPISVTVISATASALLFRAARQRWGTSRRI